MLIENPAEGHWPLGSTRRRQQPEPLVLCVITNSPEPPLDTFWCLGTCEDSVSEIRSVPSWALPHSPCCSINFSPGKCHGVWEAHCPLVISPSPLTVSLWDEVMLQGCLGWLCFPKLCSEILAGIGLWQSCGRLQPFSAQGFFNLSINSMGSKMSQESKKQDPHLKAASQKVFPSPGSWRRAAGL